MKKINWGIMATGGICKKFCKDVALLDDAKLLSVGSREMGKAENFAKQFGVERAYGSYEELVKDKDVDVIYIGTPHPMHLDNVLLCLEHGKAVLCEKPMTTSVKDTATLIEAAHKNDIFLMEAMWTRFIPITRQVRKWVDDGEIGDIQLIRGDFGADIVNRNQWRWHTELAGGGLIDLGIYPIAYANYFMGAEPVDCTSQVVMSDTGVDEMCAMSIKYPGNRLASLSYSMPLLTDTSAVLCGTKGYITIPNFIWSKKAILSRKGQEDVVFEKATVGAGYQFEAMEVHECLRSGKKQSDIMSHDDSLILARTMEAIQKTW